MQTKTKILILLSLITLGSWAGSKKHSPKQAIHAVTDLSHEFTFYSDHRFHAQYLPKQKAVTNWCNLWNFDFSNTNLLILPGCDNRIAYSDKDLTTIKSFLNKGGGVVVLGKTDGKSQNDLLRYFGAEFTGKAQHPLSAKNEFAGFKPEGNGGSALKLETPRKWKIIVHDAANQPMMASRKVGKGTLLVASRNLAGSNPNASDSINKEIWRPLLIETASGKAVDPTKRLDGRGIEDLEHNDDHGTFKLSYNDYMKPFAESMVDVYKRTFPYIEKRMGVPLSPGMASQITLLATDGGGFSSGSVVALAVWWGGFPERDDSMIEFLTHESVHSWVLPYAEVWNEPIATYVGNLLMMDMGYAEEAQKRIQQTIARASKLDPDMNLYDIDGSVTGSNGRELNNGEKNNIHWGKTYWIFEQLRKENPDFIAKYFKLKREFATREKITKYDMNNTVTLLSRVMGKDLFPWFNQHGIIVDKKNAEIISGY